MQKTLWFSGYKEHGFVAFLNKLYQIDALNDILNHVLG
jgi:hypothetical protein